MNDFAIFILTHGRPDKVYTYTTLKRSGYTGKIYIIVDNEDKTTEQYKEKFENVIVFDKKEISKTFDEGDNFEDRRAIIYARNASFEIAKNLGLKYFMQMDDDYDRISYKYSPDLEFKENPILNFDSIVFSLLEYYKSANFKSIAMAQNGDYVSSGRDALSFLNERRIRKCMNTILCSVDRHYQFIGRVNEDVNTYTKLGSQGELFLTIPFIAINQKQTQSNSGGMTEMYLESGTYVKSFYSVMYHPSSIKIEMLNTANKRLHHKIKWVNTVVCIIRENVKK